MNIPFQIKEALAATIKSQWPELDIQPDIAPPPRSEFGDYSSPVALAIGKAIQGNPLEVAETIKASLPRIQGVSEITVSPPGFVNFVLNYPDIAEMVFKDKPSSTKGGNISIEHTSVNPNKAAHIGHLRNATLGDTLGRILRWLGNRVEIQNYIDDLGLQVADSVVAYETFGDAPEGVALDKWLWKIYADINKEYEVRPELKERREQILHEMEEGKNKTAKSILERILPLQLKTFERFGIKYDLFTYEHDVVNNHLWEELFEVLKKKGLIHKPEQGPHAGAWVVEFGETEREDMILVRSNGLLTYTGKDLPLALWKLGLGPEMQGYEKRLKPIDRHINVIDERQSYPQSVIKHVMGQLGYREEAEHYLHLGYGVVRLSEKTLSKLVARVSDKASHSMSGRAGIGVMVDDLYETALAQQKQNHPEAPSEEIVIGSIRYYMLKIRPEREVIFDFDEALRTDGNTGVYLQYAYARAANILAKARKLSAPKIIELTEPEKNLIKILSESEMGIQTAADNLDPSLLCDYAYSLANAFAKFYETTPVLKSEGDVLNFRLALVKKYQQTLGTVLELLGIPVLEKI